MIRPLQLKYNFMRTQTMEEYDFGGQQVLYSNIKLGIQIEVNHINRYKDMTPIDVQMYELSSFRNDITYLE